MSIGADIADLNTKMDRAQGAVTSGVSKINAAVDAMKATAAFGTVVAMLGRVSDAAGTLDTLSARIGDTAGNVQRLQAVSESFDVELQAMVGAIQEMQARLGDGKIDGGLKKLNISVSDFSAMSPAQRYIAVADALAKIKDPAERASIAAEVMGRKWKENSAAFREGINEVDRWIKMSDDTVEAFDRLGISWDNLSASAVNFTAMVVDNVFQLSNLITIYDNARSALNRLWMSEQNYVAWKDAQTAKELGDLLPDSPWKKGGLPVPGDPFATGGVGGNSLSFIESTLRLGGGASGASGGRMPGFTPRTSFLGSAAATIFAMKNTPGSFSAGSLPFMSSPGYLQSSGSPIDFMNGMQLMGSVPMNAPGGGGIGSWLKGHKAQVGIGIGTMAAGMLGNKIGGQAGGALSGAAQGAQMGMMFGPWGAAVGGVIGGVAGWIGAGKAAKNAKNAEIGEVFKQFSSKEFIALQTEADKLGVSLEKALNAKTMKDFTAATEEAAAKLNEINTLQGQIDSLKEKTTVDFDKMNSIVKEFGLDISSLGPAFQQAGVDKEAQRIIDAFAVMEKGGADMNGVLAGMADEIGALVADSIKFGTTIPENMRPWVEKLMESGQLVDKQGTKITDISGLKFGQPMQSEMSKLTEELDRLIGKMDELMSSLKTKLPGAIRDVPDIDIDANIRFRTRDGDNTYEQYPAMAKGGIVTRPTLALVGEAGPEAVIPLNSRHLPSGQPMVVNVTVNNGRFDGYASAQQFARDTLDALAGEASRRGLRTAFAGA